MSTDTTTRTTRTITLTDRRPVKIANTDWPIIASADGDSYQSLDYARHQQAAAQGELDEWWLRARQHADGRTLVYGRYTTGWSPQAEDWAGGEIVEAGADIAATIRRVGESGSIPDATIRACIADLPAEEL